MQVTIGGLERLYLRPFPLSSRIPTVRQLLKKPEEYENFMEHITRNHKGANWKIYRHKLTSKNYKSFIYAFAHQMAFMPTSHTTSWQINSNARRLKKALKRVAVDLYPCEEEIINICLNFNKWSLTESERIKRSNELKEKLIFLYLG